MQGDVYKVVNASGTVVASYTYDAWGKILSATGSMAAINPIRYRGYYYDAESGLYYLNSRYYDPEVGRFISAEPSVYDGEFDGGAGLLAYNVCIYCVNDPVNYYDPDGREIRLSTNATAEEIKQYNRAIQYLQTSNTGKALVQKLQKSKTVFTIIFINDHKDRYELSTKYIYWNIYSGLVMRDRTSIQSAALGLAHEMGHAAQHLDGQLKGIPYFIEMNNLRKYETPIAKQLGEPTRRGYMSCSGAAIMSNSTHYVTTTKKWTPGWWPWQWFRTKTIITVHNK